jgi:hypothetical protein
MDYKRFKKTKICFYFYIMGENNIIKKGLGFGKNIISEE